MNSIEEIYLWVAVLLGTLIGSFLNVVIYRLPRKESLVWPGSHCPVCEKPIHPRDNLPVVSFIMLRGRCRGCGTRISRRYPIVEAVNGSAYGLIVWYFGPGGTGGGLRCPFFLAAGHFLHRFRSSNYSRCHYLARNRSRYPCREYPIAHRLGQFHLWSSVGRRVLLLLAWVSPYLFGKKEWGEGIIKLLAMIGAFLGWQAVILTMLIGAIVGATVGVSLMAFRILRRDQYLPFGPFLAFGAIVSMFFHEELFSWYITFLALPQ